MLNISEVFASIEGEGVDVGLPTHFVRVAGCSVGCEWCDTKYAWGEGDSEKYPVELDQMLRTHGWKTPCKRLGITGGEPFEQAAGLVGFFEWASTTLSHYDRINVETSGTVWNDATREFISHWLRSGRDCLTISPKMSSAKAKVPYETYKIFDMAYWATHVGAHTQIKIAVLTLEDVAEALGLFSLIDRNIDSWDHPDKLFHVTIDAVLVPVMDPRAVTYSVDPELFNVSIYGQKLQFNHLRFRFGIQMQKVIWGCQRKGV